jgi:hypothetical protein
MSVRLHAPWTAAFPHPDRSQGLQLPPSHKQTAVLPDLNAMTYRVRPRFHCLVLILLGIMGCMALPSLAQSDNVALPNFEDAERRIVYNKTNGLPRYAGVTIEYAFRLTSEVGWTSGEDLTSTIGNRFEGVLSTSIVSEGEHVLLLVLTDGHLANHDVYDAVIEQYGSSLARHTRKYFLK